MAMKIAVQSKGRLKEQSLAFLRSLGLKFTLSDRNLITKCDNYDLEILFLRDDDIPEYVNRAVVDLGIVGRNVAEEKSCATKVASSLKFAECRLVIAVPKNSEIKDLSDLEGERIATSYPKITAQFLQKNGVKASIIPITGSVEIATGMNLADAICDITQSGDTLKENNLKELITVMNSEAVLIKSPSFNLKNFELWRS